MAITIPSGISTRARLRDYLHDTLAALVGDATQKVPSGEWEGVPVVTIKDLGEAIAATFGGDLPPLDAKVAEISTPGTVYVSAECMDCHQRQSMTVEIDSFTTIDRSGRELALKAKSKKRTHVCGQQPLPVAAPEGQESFELEDIIGDQDAPSDRLEDLVKPGETLDEAWARLNSDEDVVASTAGQALLDAVNDGRGAEVPFPRLASVASPEPCPFAGCTLAAEHTGDHDVAPAAGDDDLLPA